MVPFAVMNGLDFYLRFWPLGFRVAQTVSVHISSQGSKKLKHVEVRHIEAAHTMLDPTIVPDTFLKHCMPHSLTETAKPAQDETRARQHIQ